jgi:hypothetical protein
MASKAAAAAEPKLRWKSKPDEHDYPAAESYLTLLCIPAVVAELLVAFRRDDDVVKYKVKDILRASGLELLPPDNPHVSADLDKVKDGKQLSPVLLVRGTLGAYPLVIADGYHRVCAAYHTDENAEVPCKLVDR